MSVKRALAAASLNARSANQALSRTMDRKEAQNEMQKKVNELVDLVETSRADGKLEVHELEALHTKARELGMLTDLHTYTSTTDGENGDIKLVDDKGEKIQKNVDAINGLIKKFERNLEKLQGDTGQIDLQLKMRLNDLTQTLQDASSLIQVDKDNKSNIAIRA